MTMPLGRREGGRGPGCVRAAFWVAGLLAAGATWPAAGCGGKHAGPLPAVCGDGAREGGEACDGTDLGGATCASVGYAQGTLACTPGCALDRAGCHGRCGDGMAQPDEACDGTDFGGATCQALGYEGGTLSCAPWCLRSEQGCHRCGDGRVDAEEQCDGENLGGLTCGLLSGGAMGGELRCGGDCRLNSAGCVPPATCGNGIKEAGEQCDGEDLGALTCALVYPGHFEEGTLSCQPNCLFDPRSCRPASPCGNGVAETDQGEQCDGGDLGDATCESLGFGRGTLFCAETCHYDVGHCGPSLTCGNGVREPMEPCEGDDLGYATCQDFGFEGGTLGCTGECQLDPSGCNHCGDGARGADEECDGADVGGVTCGELGFYGAAPGCHGDCTFDLEPCRAAGWCGDGVRQHGAGEECDGADLGPATCHSFGYYGGSLGCHGDCTYDVAPCEIVGWCGDGIRQQGAGEECDGADFGGDTCGGHGLDSGVLRCDAACVMRMDECGLCGNGRCEVGEPGACLSDCRAQLLAAGGLHTCAVRADRSVWCWGDSLGNGAATSGHERFAPGPVVGPGGAGILTGALGVAAGGQHSCAVRANGTVWCWGAGGEGQLGDGLGQDSATPVQVVLADGTGPLTGAVAVAAGGGWDADHFYVGFSCALRFDRTLYCWGDNAWGQLGDSTLVSRPAAAPVTDDGGVSAFSEVVSISTGGAHACATRSDGTLWCWGSNADHRLGILSPWNVRVPGQVTALSSVASVSAGFSHTCAVGQDGATWCWGYGAGGRLGTGTETTSYSPVLVSGLGSATQVHAGWGHTCALLNGGEVWCWGKNAFGQVGDGSWQGQLTPVWVASGVADLRVGGYHTCVRETNGTHACWGGNWDGQLGIGTSTRAWEPIAVAGGGSYVALSADNQRTCAVASDGTAWCWGGSYVGDGTSSRRLEPTPVLDASGLAPLGGVVSIAVGEEHSCASLQDGRVVCWGANWWGLGDGTREIRLVPVFVAGPGGVGELDGVVSLGAGRSHSCAVRSDGSLWCWGDNDRRQLGDGTSSNDRLTPVQVLGPGGVGTLEGVVQVAGGTEHTCAVRSDGTAWCWGDCGNFCLGTGGMPESVPAQVLGVGGVGTLEEVLQVTAARRHTCAVSAAGLAWCWGDSAEGALGLGPANGSRYPALVAAGALRWIAAGRDHTCAARAPSAGPGATCWGINRYNQLGTGLSLSTNTPAAVVGLPALRAVAAGYLHSCAMADDGSLWCWGNNTTGALGNPDWYHQAWPRVVPGF